MTVVIHGYPVDADVRGGVYGVRLRYCRWTATKLDCGDKKYLFGFLKPTIVCQMDCGKRT